jgi:hypothetical protein
MTSKQGNHIADITLNYTKSQLESYKLEQKLSYFENILQNLILNMCNLESEIIGIEKQMQ